MDIKGVVRAHGTTLTSVAEKMGITKGRLSQIINEKPTVDNLRTIAGIVGCKVGDFFADEISDDNDSSLVTRCPHCGKELCIKIK
jgi:transcriptional regulator with XRE-family HTH domain